MTRLRPPDPVLHTRQRGSALFMALIILIALTILSLASLGTSLLELKMSNNTEASMSAFQAAQSAIDNTTFNDSVNFVIVGDIGHTNCTSNESDCDIYGVSLPSPFSTGTKIRITRISDAGCPPVGSSCNHQSGATFNVHSEYDRSSVGQGRAELDQGYVKIFPAAPGYYGGGPTNALGN